MTSKLEQLRALAAEHAETADDYNVAQKGGGGGRLLPEGYAFAQLVEYVEFGKQPQQYQGVPKDPALEFQLGLALSGEGYSNEDGTPYLARPFPLTDSKNEKAGAFLTFKKLNYKGTYKTYAQMLGEKFLVKIVHVPKDKSKPLGPDNVRWQLDLKSTLPPLDPVTKKPYPIPDAPDELYQLFLWDKPTKEGWDALYIAGQWEAADGKPARSKNTIQEKILGAVDFNGSALEALLLSNGVAIPTVAAKPAAPAAPATPAGPVAPVAPTSVIAAPAPAAPATVDDTPPWDAGTAAPVAKAPAPAAAPVAAPVLPVIPDAVMYSPPAA